MDGIIASEAEAAAGPGGTTTEADGVRTLLDAEAEEEASPGGGPRAAGNDDGDPDLGGVEDVVDVGGANEEEEGDAPLLGPSAPDRRAPAPPDVEERELVEREDAESSGSSAAGMSGDTRGSGSGGYSGDYSSISDSSSERGSSGIGGSDEKKEAGKKSLVAHHLPHRSKGGRSGPERGGADGTAGASKPKPGAKEGGTGAAGNDARRSPASEGLLRPLRDGAAPDRPESNAHRRHSPGHHSHPHQHQHQHPFLNQEPHHLYHRHAHHHPARGGNKAKAKEQVNRKIDEIMNLYNVSLQAAATREGDVDAGDDIKRPGEAVRRDSRRDSLQVEADGTDGYLEPLPPCGEARAPQPQLGGTTARNPADPRVQAQQPYRTASTAVAYPAAVPVAVPHLYRPLAASASRASSAIEARPRDLEAPDVPPVGYREPCYADLMEACRPFFHDSQALLAATASGQSIPMLPTVDDGNVDGAGRANAGSDEAQSSSGFTSFFTTTKSESNQTHSGSGGSLSEPSQRRVARANAAEQQRQHAGLQHAGHQHAALQHAPREHAGAMNADPAERARLASSPSTEATKRSPSPSDDIVDPDHSDSSSMVVLARVKRKHKEQGGSRPAVGPGGAAAARSSSNSDLTQASPHAPKRGSAEGVGVGGAAEHPGSSKRVRIETVALDRASKRPRESAGGQGQQQKQPPERRTESSSFTSSLTQSLDSSGSDSGARPKETANEAAEGGGSGSNADSKSDPAAGEGTSASQDAGTAGKPRVVTDISSGTTTANGSSGSGTGSGVENTTGKSESGSGGDGKSESGSGDGDGDGGSDGQNNKLSPGPEGGQSAAGGAAPPLGAEAPAPESRKADKPLIHHHAGRHDQADRAQAPSEGSDAGVVAPCGAAAAPDQREEEAEAATTSKEKIMEKKRKRMNMRREYEEEVQRQMRDSSESSSIAYETALEPGKPVTLEEVLSFTKTARLLVQALPPFLAVHVNAAFTSLCGIQSSSAIGTPVASIISLPDTTVNKESDSSGSDNTNNKDAMSSLSGSVDGNGQNNSNMAIANDAAMQGDAVGPQGPNAQVQNGVGLRIDRLIVARGYGHIHEVEVVSVPHHSHAHAIEGSEVRFMEGNAPAKRKKKGESKILCRMSVSPVISTTPATRHHSTADANSTPPSSANGKRRKLRPAPNELNSVKHYLIQLEAVEGPRLLMSRSSCTSATDTTMEAQLLGITKTEVYARRCRLENRRVQNPMEAQVNDSGVNGPETEDSQDDNTSGMEPVATCG